MNNDSQKNHEETQEKELIEEIIPEEENPQAVIKNIRNKLKECEASKQEYLSGWQRAKADLINTRKSSEEERKKFSAFAISEIFSQLIPVLDSFEMAFKAEFWNNAEKDWKAGIENIYEQLKQVMSQNGVEEIKPEEKSAFDPKEQEAVMSEQVSSIKEDNTVTAVIQHGYKIGNQVIRPAKVKVGEFREN